MEPEVRALHPLLAHVDAGRLQRLPENPCPYLPGLTARKRAFLAEAMDGELYHDLMDRGFRRSGDFFYAMDCENCRACVPLRVPVDTFQPSKSQRRVLRRNPDVALTAQRPQCTDEVFALYQRYLAFQHPDSGQTGETQQQLEASLYANIVDSVELRYTIGDRLVAVSLVDLCSRSVSAVYHFYDPDERDRSLGVFSVLAEIDWTRQLGVPHYYLGYWVEGAETMHYKANYRPHEQLRDGIWRAV